MMFRYFPVFFFCVLPTMTYGCQTWSLTKATTQRLRTAQRAMERKMLKAKLKDKIPCREIRAKTNIKDVVKFAAKQKWKWAGHVARLNDNRWTKRITDWQNMAKDHEVDRWRDGETTSCRWKESLGAEMPDSETTGDVMRRATSCSGWTEPRYNGIFQWLKVKSRYLIKLNKNYDFWR